MDRDYGTATRVGRRAVESLYKLSHFQTPKRPVNHQKIPTGGEDGGGGARSHRGLGEEKSILPATRRSSHGRGGRWMRQIEVSSRPRRGERYPINHLKSQLRAGRTMDEAVRSHRGIEEKGVLSTTVRFSHRPGKPHLAISLSFGSPSG